MKPSSWFPEILERPLERRSFSPKLHPSTSALQLPIPQESYRFTRSASTQVAPTLPFLFGLQLAFDSAGQLSFQLVLFSQPSSVSAPPTTMVQQFLTPIYPDGMGDFTLVLFQVLDLSLTVSCCCPLQSRIR